MADARLTLGEFEFQNYELPESLPFGGAQKLITHTLPGGFRVVQAMGRDDAPIGWSGLFFGPDATDRAKQLDVLRTDGKPLKLKWRDFIYLVYIQSFTASMERFYQVRYQISCLVVSDLSNSCEAYSDTSFDSAITADNTLAQSLGVSIGDSTLTGLLGTMDTAIKSVSTFAGQATATINGIIAPVAAVAQRVQILTASTANTINSIATLGGVLPNTSIAQAAGRLTSQLTAAQQLPLLSQLGSVVGRITTNLNVVGGVSANVRQVSTVGGNLFDKAAALYGDATKWVTLAKANGTTDPNITGVTTLNVPNNAPNNGGVIQ